MSFQISPDELFESFEEFARNHYVIAISHSQIRKIIVRLPAAPPPALACTDHFPHHS